jgi:hypothetical protein
VNGVHSHWDINEAHHDGQTEAGDGHHMEVTLSSRLVLERRHFIFCTHSELLLFAHAAHIRRVCGLYLAKPSIGRFVARIGWAVRSPALAS